MAEAPRRSPPGRTSSATRILLILTALGAVVFLATIAVVVWAISRADRGEVHDDTWLRMSLKGQIEDAPVQGGIFADPANLPPTPGEMARAIRAAAADERIEGLYIDLNTPMMGWGVAQELRDAIVDFRASGKPCVAYAEVYQNGDYYLASACDRIVLAPSGVTLVAGLSTSITYYSGTFEKLGVDPEFEHVGDFKSAVEPYERTEPSEGALIAYNSLLDGIYGRFIADVAAGRGRSEEEIRALIDNPPMSPDDALQRGLVDALAFPDAVEATLAGSTAADWAAKLAEVKTAPEDFEKADEERFTDLDEYVKDVIADDAGKDNLVAVVYAEGPIVSGDGGGGLFGGQMLADGPFREWMREAREDEQVKAIVLRVNSPGGSGLASDMMWREIELTQAAGKPVVVSMANYAASGGYYIAAPADWIVAQPSTLTGSIGVFGGKMNLSGTYEKLGITEYQFKRGENADLLSMTRPFTDGGRQVFRSYLEDFYAQFLARVAAGRDRTPEEIHEIAQGRVWTGEQALANGLVDELGGLDVAVAKAAELAKAEDVGIVQIPKAKSFLDLVLEDMAEGNATVQVELVPPVPGAEDAMRELFVLDAVLADGGVAAYMPGEISVK